MVHANSNGLPRDPPYSGDDQKRLRAFAYGAITLYGRTFQTSFASAELCNSSAALQNHTVDPTTPDEQHLQAITPTRFRLFPVRSPLLGKSLLLSIPRGTKMVHSPRLASPSYVFTRRYRSIMSCRFPHSEIHGSKLAWQLPVAYRSQPRLSSPPGARASTTHPL